MHIVGTQVFAKYSQKTKVQSLPLKCATVSAKQRHVEKKKSLIKTATLQLSDIYSIAQQNPSKKTGTVTV